MFFKKGFKYNFLVKQPLFLEQNEAHLQKCRQRDPNPHYCTAKNVFVRQRGNLARWWELRSSLENLHGCSYLPGFQMRIPHSRYDHRTAVNWRAIASPLYDVMLLYMYPTSSHHIFCPASHFDPFCCYFFLWYSFSLNNSVLNDGDNFPFFSGHLSACLLVIYSALGPLA